ncbi:MAG: 4Fe-4S dicluster domain-containing protein [Bacteroidota bacterium]
MYVELEELNSLFTALQNRGYTIIGPRVQDGAVVLDTLTSADELPRGWRDNQEPGVYELEEEGGDTRFSYVVGPQSWKRYLYPPRLRLFRTTRSGKGFRVDSSPEESPARYAFFGVRPCELAAMGIHDRVFLGSGYQDHHYAEVRKSLCIIAVNCVQPGGTCFCASMKTGPRAHEGFDLAITEVKQDGRHYLIVERGSPLGGEIMNDVPHREPEQADRDPAEHALAAAEDRMGRSLNTNNLQQVFKDQFEHPHWDEIANRCLGCANCTMVCPTCFCSTVEDVTDLTGAEAERWRRWDSCFTGDFTKVAGGNIRMSTRTRYRQWITHKLANWIDQFGTTGCVGCGRCITWCPVGIDITAEAETFRQHSHSTTIG